MKKKAIAALAVGLGVALLAGEVWAQAVGLRSTVVLQSSTTAIGQPLEFPLFRNQLTAAMVEVAPGGQTGRHMHPAPTFVYVLEGEFTIEIEGQPARTYRPGQAFLESVKTWHNGINRGSTPVKFLVVFAGEEGVPTTVRP